MLSHLRLLLLGLRASQCDGLEQLLVRPGAPGCLHLQQRRPMRWWQRQRLRLQSWRRRALQTVCCVEWCCLVWKTQAACQWPGDWGTPSSHVSTLATTPAAAATCVLQQRATLIKVDRMAFTSMAATSVNCTGLGGSSDCVCSSTCVIPLRIFCWRENLMSWRGSGGWHG